MITQQEDILVGIRLNDRVRGVMIIRNNTQGCPGDWMLIRIRTRPRLIEPTPQRLVCQTETSCITEYTVSLTTRAIRTWDVRQWSQTVGGGGKMKSRTNNARRMSGSRHPLSSAGPEKSAAKIWSIRCANSTQEEKGNRRS